MHVATHRTTLTCLALAVVLGGCLDDGAVDASCESCDVGAPDAGVSSPDATSMVADSGPHHCLFEGRTIPAGMSFGDGCNECFCPADRSSFGCAGDLCPASCTAALCCYQRDAGAASCIVECSAQLECGEQSNGPPPCLFEPGCEAPVGRCVHVQSTCGHADEPNVPVASADESPSFCGCDGVTYRGRCPKVPYRHPGPCP